MVNFKIYDVTNYPISQEVKATRQSYAKCDGRASPRPFYKKPKFSIYLDQQSEVV